MVHRHLMEQVNGTTHVTVSKGVVSERCMWRTRVWSRGAHVWRLAMPLSMAVHQHSQYKKASDAVMEHGEQSAPCHRISFLLTRLRSGAWFSKNSHLACLLLCIKFGCGHIMVVMGWCYKNGGGGATRRRRGSSWSFGGGGEQSCVGT